MAENKEFKSLMKGLEESLEYAKDDKSKARKMSVTVTDNINKENSILAKELSESDSLKKMRDSSLTTVWEDVKNDMW